MKKINCIECGKEFIGENGHQIYCSYSCRRKRFNRLRRENRKRTHNAEIHRYEKTPKGFLVRKHRNMRSRVLGIQKKKAHLYKGLPILDRQDFYKWALKNREFWKLFRVWEKSNYDRKLCPTVNRIDPLKGYELSNMEWLTHSENSRLGALSQRRK